LANHKSAIKRTRQSEERRLRNKAHRTRVKSVVKVVRQALEEGKGDEAAKALALAAPVIGKAASKGVIHRRTASRKISRLARQVHASQNASA